MLIDLIIPLAIIIPLAAGAIIAVRMARRVGTGTIRGALQVATAFVLPVVATIALELLLAFGGCMILLESLSTV